MVKYWKYFTEYEKLMLLMYGTSYAMYVANEDKENYKLYKQGYTRGLSEEEIKEMEVLWVLYKLGYSDDELGTYLYKDVIIKICNRLKNASNKDILDEYKVLISELSDAFSLFYRYAAREDKEMGVKPFHLYIEKAINNINDDAVDKELSMEIYGDNPGELNYGLNALQIAACILDKYSFENTQGYKKPLVKRLPNMPDDIGLKIGF